MEFIHIEWTCGTYITYDKTRLLLSRIVSPNLACLCVCPGCEQILIRKCIQSACPLPIMADQWEVGATIRSWNIRRRVRFQFLAGPVGSTSTGGRAGAGFEAGAFVNYISPSIGSSRVLATLMISGPRLKPSYDEFHFEGLSNFSASDILKGWFKSQTSIQEYRNEIQTRVEFVHGL